MARVLGELKSARQLMKEQGIRALFKRYGWKLVAVLFCYYLVRDLSLYVLLPFFVTRML